MEPSVVPTPERFECVFRECLAPRVDAWRERRRDARRNTLILAGVAGALALLALAAAPGGAKLWLVAPIVLVASMGYGYGIRRPLRDFYKRQFVQPLAEAFGLAYRPSDYVASRAFDASGLFSSYNRYGGEDYFAGRLGATDLEFSELTVKEVTGSGKDQRETTVFKGLFLSADFHKDFKRRTFVFPDTAERMLGFLGRALQKMNVFQAGKLILMDHAEFEKEFAVYAEDPIEARYLLTPALMDRLLTFKRRTGGTLRASFVGSRLYLAVSGLPDLFEPRGGDDADPRAECERLFREIELAAGVVDELSLNTRIWTKA